MAYTPVMTIGDFNDSLTVLSKCEKYLLLYAALESNTGCISALLNG